MQPDEYRKMAEVEDSMWYYRALHRHVLRVLLAALPANAYVLDAGCGSGGLLRRIRQAKPDWRLTGLDYSPLACELARDRAQVEVVQGSVAALPFGAAGFDAVVSCDVLCQVTDPLSGLREMERCLKPGGLVVLTMPAYAWMYSYHDRAVGNLRRYARREVDAMVRAAGFTIESSTYWNMLPLPLAIVRRKILPPAAPTSDVARFSAPVEGFFNGLMGIEHAWFNLGGWLPCGNSVLTVGRKSQQSVPPSP